MNVPLRANDRAALVTPVDVAVTTTNDRDRDGRRAEHARGPVERAVALVALVRGMAARRG
jgi:hypothetical protein